jgi:hypothetical protein
MRGEVFLTNKEEALSGSIEPLRGNEEDESSSAFEISVAGAMPSFGLAFWAKLT